MKIYSAFHIDYNPDDGQDQEPGVPTRTMHEFLKEIADFIETNASSEDIEFYQPEVLRRIALVLKNRHEGGWSLEEDFEEGEFEEEEEEV